MNDSEKTASDYVDTGDGDNVAEEYTGHPDGSLTKAFFDLDLANAPVMEVQRLPHFPENKELQRATPGSSGFDLYAAIDEPIRLNIIGHRATIPTGIKVAVPYGYECQVRPRSGLSHNHGVTVLNAPGTIDSDFRGEIGVILVLIGQGKFTVEPGDRIAQLVVTPITHPVVNYVEELDNTSRGAGGFGHTGLK